MLVESVNTMYRSGSRETPAKWGPKLIQLILNSYGGVFINRWCSSHHLQAEENIEWVNPSKRGGMDGVFRGAALPARGKPHSSRLFYSHLHSIGHFGDIFDFSSSNIDV